MMPHLSNRRSRPFVVLASILAVLTGFSIKDIAAETAETKIGGNYTTDSLISLAGSPYAVVQDIVVEEGVTLTIEPGVILNFQTGVRMIIDGVLIARGTATDDIAMYSRITAGRLVDDVRLVGADAPHVGRVQVRIDEEWKSVCWNQQWGYDESAVVCWQLGFGSPLSVPTREPRSENTSTLQQNFHCEGNEDSIFDCIDPKPTNCVSSYDVSIDCTSYANRGYSRGWGGILFDTDTTSTTIVNGGQIFHSSSVLEFVTIEDAGLAKSSDGFESIVPSVQIVLASPFFKNVTISDAIGTSIELVSVHGDVHLDSVSVLYSSYYAIQGSCSRVFECINCLLEGNFAGGIALDRIPLALDISRNISHPIDFSYPADSSKSSSHFVGDDGLWFTFAESSATVYRTLYTTESFGLTIDYVNQQCFGGTCDVLDVVTGANPFAKLRWKNSTMSHLSATFTSESNRLLFTFKPQSTNGMTGNVLAFAARHPLGARKVSIIETVVNKGNSSWSVGEGVSLSGYLGTVSIDSLWAENHKTAGLVLSGAAGNIGIKDSFLAYFFSYDYNSNPDWDIAEREAADIQVASFSVEVVGCEMIGYYYYGLSVITPSQTLLNVSGNTVRKGVNNGQSPIFIKKTVSMPVDPQGRLMVANRTVTVNRNTVISSWGTGLTVIVSDSTGGTDQIEVTENVVGGAVSAFQFQQVTGNSSTRSTISRNNFSDNYDENYDGNPYFSYWAASVTVTATTAASVVIEKNNLERNRGPRTFQIDGMIAFDPSRQNREVVSFNDNRLTDNTVKDGWVGSTPNSVLQVGTTLYVSCQHNILNNPQSKYELAIDTRTTTSLDKMDFQFNFWGTTNQSQIQSRIYDFDDTNFVASAVYFPYLLSDNLTAVSTGSPLKPSFVNRDGILGGQLDQSLTLSAFGSPYVVKNDITILRNATLTIDAGVRLRFERENGILVEGSLVTKGTPNNPVVFSSTGQASDSKIAVRLQGQSPASNRNGITGLTQLRIGGIWYTLCATDLSDYPAVRILTTLACSWLGYPTNNFFSSYWWPENGSPMIYHSSCPSNASDPSDCKLTLGKFGPGYSEVCQRVAYLSCYSSDGGSTDNVWAGIRFRPLPDPTTGILPDVSRLASTRLVNAGVWFSDRLATVDTNFNLPIFNNVSVENSVGSSAFAPRSFASSYSISGLTVNGTSQGEGISVATMPFQSLVIKTVSSVEVQGNGFKIQMDDSCLQGQSSHLSLCSSANVLSLNFSTGVYIGVSETDHQAQATCRKTIKTQAGAKVSILVLSMELYFDDQLTVYDSDNSAVVKLSGVASAIAGLYFSKSNTMSIELKTGQFSNAPGFLLYATSAKDSFLPSPSVLVDSASVMIAQRYCLNANLPAISFALQNSRLENCSLGGIKVECSDCSSTDKTSTTTVAHNTVRGCGSIGQLMYGSTRSDWDVKNNDFLLNEGGLTMLPAASNETKAGVAQISFANNVFDRNNGSSLVINSFDISAEITNNSFTGLKAMSSKNAMSIEGTVEQLLISDNKYTGSWMENVVKLTPYPFTRSSFTFYHNQLFDNVIDSLVETCNTTSANRIGVLLVTGSAKVVIRNNSFVNPSSEYQLVLLIPVQSSTENVVDVRYNYWGTTVGQTITDSIYDFNYCTQVASAKIFPFLMKPFGLPAPPGKYQPPSIYRPNNVLIGQVLTNTTIPYSSHPYTVIGDLSVPPGKSLTISAGVKFNFKPNVGIFVEGSLSVQGTTDKPVQMTNVTIPVKQKDGDLRFTNSSQTNSGTAEIYYSGKWGAICAHDDDSQFNYYLAYGICVQLGYTREGDHAVDYSYNGDGWLQDVVCVWGTPLPKCSNYQFNRFRCEYGVMRVTCYGSPSPPPSANCQWSGIQFAAAAQSQSILENVVIRNGGRTEGQPLPALRTIEHHVQLENVTVTGSALTGIEVVNGLSLSFKKVVSTGNSGSGVCLINTPVSRLENVQSSLNNGHGLEVTVNSSLRPIWSIPVSQDRIVDICSQSGVLMITSQPVYIRYVQNALYKYPCLLKMKSKSASPIIIQTLSAMFQSNSAYVRLDGTYLYEKGSLQGASLLHYVASNGSVDIEIQPDFTSSLYSPDNYYLAFVQQIPFGSTFVQGHDILEGSLTLNKAAGISIDASSSTADRSDVSITAMTITNNSLSGIQIMGKTDDKDGTTSVSVERCQINGNGKDDDGSSHSAGILSSLDKSTAIVQTCKISENNGGAVSLTNGAVYGIYYNQVEGNYGGDTISLGHSEDGLLLIDVKNNTFIGNEGADILSVDASQTAVESNIFYKNKGTHIIRPDSNIPGSTKQYYDNILLGNIPPNESSCAIAADSFNATYRQNRFVNPAYLYEFCAGPSNGKKGVISAAQNWWGTPILSEAKKKVQDFSNNPSLMRIEIVPIQTQNPLNATGCPFLWLKHNNLCYLFVRGALNWTSAESYCQSFGGYLASTHFAQTDAFLHTMIPSVVGFSGMWLGLHYNSRSGKWEWSDGSSYDHSILKYNSPQSGHCASMRTGYSAAESCSDMKPFVCSSDAGPSEPSFEKAIYNASIAVGSQVGDLVTAVSAADPGSGQMYYFLVGNYSGGFFKMGNKTKGDIIVARYLDASAYPHYVIRVKAENSQNPDRLASATVIITVTCSPTGKCPGTIKSDSHVGVIVGGVVGGVAFISVVIVVVLLAVRKSRNKANVWISFDNPTSGDSVEVAKPV